MVVARRIWNVITEVATLYSCLVLFNDLDYVLLLEYASEF